MTYIKLDGLPVPEEHQNSETHRRLLAKAINRLAQSVSATIGTVRTSTATTGTTSFSRVIGLSKRIAVPVLSDVLVRVEVLVLGTGIGTWNCQILVDGRVVKIHGVSPPLLAGEHLLFNFTAPLFRADPSRARLVTVEIKNNIGGTGATVATGSQMFYQTFPRGD